MREVYDYTGVIHFHSVFSFDGRTTIQEILKAARRRNIDFLMLTDHGILEAKRQGFAGWCDGILLIVGQEISPRFNHYIAFGIEHPIPVTEDDFAVSPQAYIDDVFRQGGLGFIAHPDHEGTKLFHVKHYPWLGGNIDKFNGISTGDFMTDWQSSLTIYGKAAYSYLSPALSLRGPRAETLLRWDNLNLHLRVIGIGELDNHNSLRKIFGLPFSIFPFSRAFRWIRTHLLTTSMLSGNSEKETDLLLSTLAKSHAYVAMEAFAPTHGFSFRISEGDQDAIPGDDFFLRESSSKSSSS